MFKQIIVGNVAFKTKFFDCIVAIYSKQRFWFFYPDVVLILLTVLL